MSNVVLTIGPDQQIGDAARLMAEREVGAAVVIDPELPGPGILTERDVLRAFANDPRRAAYEPVRAYATSRAVYATPDWSLERAADEMVGGGFRHLIVVDGGEIVGVLSMRDIVACWVREGATSELPADLQPR